MENQNEDTWTDGVNDTSHEMPTLQPGKLANIDLLPLAPVFAGRNNAAAFQEILESRCSYETAAAAIREMMFLSHGSSFMKGWWHDKNTGALLDQAYQVPIKLALIHSEVSEALEADRKGEMDDKLPDRPGIEVELADVLHRVFDLAGALNLDLAGAFVEKGRFNAARPDHAPENRLKENGKAY